MKKHNVWNYKLFGDSKVRHHLLEIILWPNCDGTFKTIINEAKDLISMGIYNNKMTFEMTNSDHTTLHNKYWSERRREKQRKSLTGYKHDDAFKAKISAATKGEKNPMYGKDAWQIACSRKTPEQIEATRKSKSEKMKAYWMNKRQNKEG